VSVEKHIEPALYYKDSLCIQEQVTALTPDTLYQLACLLNGNIFDFGLKGELREKVRNSLCRKEKAEVEKKETKVFGKKTVEPAKSEQREEDVEAFMTEQFMNYAHFILIGDPASPTLRHFLSHNPDIVGSLHFAWLLLPE
jgi:hypothetical protein